MDHNETAPAGPDFAQGILFADLKDSRMLLGHVAGEPVLLVRRGANIYAVGAHCTHYHAPLSQGIVTDETIRCPWHHACFDFRTGEAVRAPAFSPLDRWSVEHREDKVFVRGKRQMPSPNLRHRAARRSGPDKIVIVGGGAAGFAAAETLRREQFRGSIVMLSDDDAPPVDRPNLSKDYLAGDAPEDWVPLRQTDFYSKNEIDLRHANQSDGSR